MTIQLPPGLSTQKVAHIEYNGIRFSREAITFIDFGRITNTISKQQIQKIAVKLSIRSTHPILQAITGASLTGLGLWNVFLVILWGIYGGTLSSLSILAIGLVPLGIWVIIDGFRREMCLVVQLDGSNKKLAFQQAPEREAVKQLLLSARQLFGYIIEDLEWL